MRDVTGVIVVTGIMAAGKSTVAQLLAERFPRSVHLRGDLFRRMIVRGQEPIGSPLSEDATAQLRLRYRLAVAAADGYAEAGFTVVLQDGVAAQAMNHLHDTFFARDAKVSAAARGLAS